MAVMAPPVSSSCAQDSTAGVGEHVPLVTAGGHASGVTVMEGSCCFCCARAPEFSARRERGSVIETRSPRGDRELILVDSVSFHGPTPRPPPPAGSNQDDDSDQAGGGGGAP